MKITKILRSSKPTNYGTVIDGGGYVFLRKTSSNLFNNGNLPDLPFNAPLLGLQTPKKSYLFLTKILMVSMMMATGFSGFSQNVQQASSPPAVMNAIPYYTNTTTPQITASKMIYDVSSSKFVFRDGYAAPANARLNLDYAGLGLYTLQVNPSGATSLSNARFDIFTPIFPQYYSAFNNGLYFRGKNNGGSNNDVMFMDYDGRVGIGTTRPKAQVHIWNDNNSALHQSSLGSGISETFLVGPYNFDAAQGQGAIKTSGEAAGFFFMDRDKTADILTSGGASTAGDWWLWSASDARATLWTPQTQNTMVIKANGNIGIGEYDPQQKLVVNGSTFIKGDLTVYDITNSKVQFKVYEDGKVRSRRIEVDLNTIPDYVFKPNYTLMDLTTLEAFIKKENHLPGIKSESEYQQQGGLDLGELNLKLLEKVEELTLHLIALKKEVEQLKNK